MPFYHAPIIHDRNCAQSDEQNSTQSSSYVDLPDATITTKLQQIGNFTVTFSALMSSTLNNTVANFRVVIGGVPTEADGVDVRVKVKDFDIGYSITCNVESVPINSILKVEYKTSVGTLTVEEYGLAIDGIPQSRIVV